MKNARDSAFNYAKSYVDKNGELQQQVKTHEITVKELKENNEALGIENGKLTNQVGRLSNLVAYYQGNASVTDTFTVVNHDTTIVIRNDLIKGKWFTWTNSNLTLTGITTDLNTSITYDYKFKFTLVSYRKPQGFLGLGRGQLVTDIKFDDPLIKVNEFKGIVIKEEPKKWYETRAVQIGAAFVIGYVIAK
jgi:hypothetical protein